MHSANHLKFSLIKKKILKGKAASLGKVEMAPCPSGEFLGEDVYLAVSQASLAFASPNTLPLLWHLLI